MKIIYLILIHLSVLCLFGLGTSTQTHIHNSSYPASLLDVVQTKHSTTSYNKYASFLHKTVVKITNKILFNYSMQTKILSAQINNKNLKLGNTHYPLKTNIDEKSIQNRSHKYLTVDRPTKHYIEVISSEVIFIEDA